MLHEAIRARAAKVRLVIFDVDGVMTDGRIIYGDHGDELKHYDVQDGFGVTLLSRAGFRTAMITAKKSRVNERRAKLLHVEKLYQDAKDKLKVFEKALKKFKVAAEEVCYVGDDLIDIPVMSRVGFAVAVQNAVVETKDKAHYVTERAGGRGAVREVCDLLLKTQGKWNDVTQRYFR